jgi:hypothetical protein
MRNFTLASVIVLAVVVVVVGIAALLLAKTVSEAQSINDKAQNIAELGTGVNEDTDSVVQLRRTNRLAESILTSANPLERQLTSIVGEAKSIDGLAQSINGTAGTINDTAGTVNSTAGNINSSATAIDEAAGSINSSAGSINSSAGSINATAGTINTLAGRVSSTATSINRSARSIDTVAATILRTARRVDTDVSLINQNLDVTLSLATAVKGDTGNILSQAVGAHDTAACIDLKLAGSAGTDGDCRGAATPASASRDRTSARGGELPARLKKLFKGQEELRRKLEAQRKAQENASPRSVIPPPSGLPGIKSLPDPDDLQDRLNGILGGKGNGGNSSGNALLDRLLRTLKLQKGGE